MGASERASLSVEALERPRLEDPSREHGSARDETVSGSWNVVALC